MRLPLRYAAGVALMVLPALALGFWPEAVAKPAVSVAHAGHGDHSPTPAIGVQTAEYGVPEGYGAKAWDRRLPEWPRLRGPLEVGPGRRYKSIDAALLEAEDGDRVVIYPGHYHGSIKAERRVWLDARPGARLMGHGGSVVTLTAPGAWVTGLAIHHGGASMDDEDAGVTVRDAPGALVAGNRIDDVKFGVVAKGSPGILIAGNAITGRDEELSLLGDGIRVWFSDGARVAANTVRHTREILIESSRNVEVRGNAVVGNRQGLHLMTSPGIAAVMNYVAGNSTGIYVMYGSDARIDSNWVEGNRGPSGYGIGLKEADGVRVGGNRLVSNRVGIYVENSPLRPERFNAIEANLVSQNDVGMMLTTSTHDNRIRKNEFVENLQQVSVSGHGTAARNLWTVDGQGNYWSDYIGYDADRDLVGDLPYAPVRVFEGWMDRRPELRMFWLTPAATLIDAAARAFPLAWSDPVLSDQRPAMKQTDRREFPWLNYRQLRSGSAVGKP